MVDGPGDDRVDDPGSHPGQRVGVEGVHLARSAEEAGRPGGGQARAATDAIDETANPCSAIFIIWDRLFGSFRAETFRPTYGLTKNIDSNNVLTLQYYEFGALWCDLRAAKRPRDRFGYLFGPPGWKPALSPAVTESGEPAVPGKR